MRKTGFILCLNQSSFNRGDVIDRREFLSAFGLGTAAVACAYCLESCKASDQVVNPPTNVDFTLDLSTPANSALKSVGGYVYNSGVIVANTPNGYIAVSSTCTHAGGTVVYQANGNLFHCPVHGSNFNTGGGVINGPAGSPLGKYNTALTGNSLRVYS